MKKHTLLVAGLLGGLLTSISCQGTGNHTMANADQAVGKPSDMTDSPQTDATDPNAPGLVRYSYVCNANPEKTVELPHIRFGATYRCGFQNDNFFINVTDNRIPIDFRLSVPGYHGPGTYTMVADVVNGTGFADCRWPAIQISDGNCPALAGTTISACCRDSDAPARALSCSVTVAQHSLTRVTGTFTCHVEAEKNGINSPFMCPSGGQADVRGSFDFGPMDCT